LRTAALIVVGIAGLVGCFRVFRAHVISLGHGPYEAALRDPDALAPVAQDAEEGDWENADGDALVQRYPRLAERFR
jgi:hypothetical protein